MYICRLTVSARIFKGGREEAEVGLSIDIKNPRSITLMKRSYFLSRVLFLYLCENFNSRFSVFSYPGLSGW